MLVAAGTYVENINYNGKNISVIGEDKETTIIDGNQNGSVVTFESEEDSTTVLTGFSIINGQGLGYPNSTGGGINILNNSIPRISDVIIRNNSAGYNARGGGIYCKTSSPQIDNIVVRSEERRGGKECRSRWSTYH